MVKNGFNVVCINSIISTYASNSYRLIKKTMETR